MNQDRSSIGQVRPEADSYALLLQLIAQRFSRSTAPRKATKTTEAGTPIGDPAPLHASTAAHDLNVLLAVYSTSKLYTAGPGPANQLIQMA